MDDLQILGVIGKGVSHTAASTCTDKHKLFLTYSFIAYLVLGIRTYIPITT